MLMTLEWILLPLEEEEDSKTTAKTFRVHLLWSVPGFVLGNFSHFFVDADRFGMIFVIAGARRRQRCTCWEQITFEANAVKSADPIQGFRRVRKSLRYSNL